MEVKFPAKNWIKTVPIDYLKYLGYNVKELYCDICGKKLRPTVFEKTGIEVIKNTYFFENKANELTFLACKVHPEHKRLGASFINSFFNNEDPRPKKAKYNEMMKFISLIINGRKKFWSVGSSEIPILEGDSIVKTIV